MNILEIITKKKNKKELTKEELSFAFLGYLNKKIPDYQMSSLLMAITINGMSLEETINLTDIFIKSGSVYNLSNIFPDLVDKHSTGGVGDTTTLIIGPMCAALDIKMAKMSGRGLGLTGGTIDKLESIPGFNVALDKQSFVDAVAKIGFAVTCQTSDLVPLDKVIYNLRDVSGSTESIPLIASSIMSKKIALGAKYILIDIKVGAGALIKTSEDAKTLIKYICAIGEHYNRVVKCILSDMDTPLSNAIGNAIEVKEAINVLKGKKGRLYDTCIEIVSNLLNMSKNIDIITAKKMAEDVIENGMAYQKFEEFVRNQNGDLSQLKVSEKTILVKAKDFGMIRKIDAEGVAKLASKLGTAKMTIDDSIDYSVGVLLNKNIGDKVKQTELILTLYVNDYNINLNDEDFNFIDIV